MNKPVTAREKRAIIEAEFAGEIDELSEALEARFGGVIFRDAEKIAKFVIVYQIDKTALADE